VPQSAFYFFLICFGNIVTTIVASVSINKFSSALSEYYYLLCSFIGVFGFGAILRNMNVTFFDKGVLTIQDWIDVARNLAAGAAIESEATLKEKISSKLCDKLMKLSDADLNARLLAKFGGETIAKLDADAAKSNVNAKLYKALYYSSQMNLREARSLMSSLP
jgi:hypothetical protein